ncbi:MAG TPA: OPT/YSL family transporter [Phycisphaerales bacterium]|nr:OPT/YSL family transporter [Phycisphaerales bacterium]
MAIKQLTEEQVRTWTVEQKDRWWLENVFRGDMPQLTLRSAVTGFLLGSVLSATNLYIGAKTGWTLGVGLTSVILAFAAFRVLSTLGARDMTILENNASQSIATAAGYMTGPLISGIAAYMMVKDAIIPWWQLMTFNVVLSVLGVLVAFPMKRRFINDEQAPFPEGQACGVVLDTLYTSQAAVGLFKAKALVAAALLAGFLKFISGESYQMLLQGKALGLSKIRWMNEHLDAWYYHMVDAGKASVPTIANIDIRKLGLSPTLDLAMFGAGGLMHIKYAANMLAGLAIAWVVLGPMAVSNGWVLVRGEALTPESNFGRVAVLNGWVLWPGVAVLVCASLAAFFAKPQVIISAFAGVLGKKKAADAQVLGHIEVPLRVSWIGVPIVGAIAVWMAHEWFQVNWWLGALSIPLIIVLTLIAANATAMTSITPTGSLSKITQFTFGVLDPKHPQTNLMTALMTTEVASNAANLLMDIKPGYMLGGKPRHQAWGHCIGIIAGALASTPLFFMLFLNGHEDNPFTPPDPKLAGQSVEQVLLAKPDEFSFISAVQWKGISEFIAGLTGDAGLTSIIHPSALWAMGIGAVVGILLEIVRIASRSKSPISPVAIGLGMVLPPDSTFWMFLGSMFFWTMGRIYRARKESFGNRLWVETHEPICAGLIAGAALTGIGGILIDVFVL